MKSLLLIVVMLASTSLFATRARIEALGESSSGSLYIEDTRNVFLNAAHVNHVADSIILEWGSQGDYDSQGSSDAEGGFFKSHGKFTYGAYLGRQNPANRSIRNVHRFGRNILIAGGAVPAVTYVDLLAPENNIDIFFGGKTTKVDWGVSVSYSDSDKESAMQTQSTYAVQLGAIMGTTEFWANVTLAAEAENKVTNEEFDGDNRIDIGFSHGFGHGYKVYGRYITDGAEHKIATTSTDSDFKSVVFGLGMTTALNDNANMFSKIEYSQSSTEFGTNELSAFKGFNTVVGVEADVKKWLTLRGSVSHQIWGTTELGGSGNTDTNADSTRMTGGASFHLGELSVDAAAGKSASAGGDFGRLGLTYNY